MTIIFDSSSQTYLVSTYYYTVNVYRGFTGVLQGFMCTGVLKYRDPLYKPCTAKSL